MVATGKHLVLIVSPFAAALAVERQASSDTKVADCWVGQETMVLTDSLPPTDCLSSGALTRILHGGGVPSGTPATIPAGAAGPFTLGKTKG